MNLSTKQVIGFSLIAIVIIAVWTLAMDNTDVNVDYRYAPKSIEKTQTRIEQRKWYVGGTLHKATMKEWSSANYYNKLVLRILLLQDF